MKVLEIKLACDLKANHPSISQPITYIPVMFAVAGNVGIRSLQDWLSHSDLFQLLILARSLSSRPDVCSLIDSCELTPLTLTFSDWLEVWASLKNLQMRMSLLPDWPVSLGHRSFRQHLCTFTQVLEHISTKTFHKTHPNFCELSFFVD